MAQQSSAAPQESSLLDKLRGKFGGLGNFQPAFLPPDQAFGLTITARDTNTLLADFRITENYYLYRSKIAFTLKSPAGAEVVRIDLPQGDIKEDHNFGRSEVYHKPFQAVLSVRHGGADKLTVDATYQGCAEQGLCYPPINKTLEVPLPGIASAAAATPPPPAASAAPARAIQTQPAAEPEESRIASLLKGGSFWLVVASFFGFGVLLSLTPCVFPMIPILSGIIVGRGHHATRSHAFALSLAYVLGMSVTYALAGVAAGLSGSMLSAALQNPWALGSFAAVFVALAFSMFGFYELQLPSALQSRLSSASNRLGGGHMVGTFGMGALSAIIVGPCVAAPLAGALLYISQTHDVVLGGVALFSMGLGNGAPLLAIGLSAGTLLPKAGAWMQAVRNFFGVVLLGVAIWIISPVVPAVVPMLMWAALLIVSAIYLHALDPLPPGASGFKKLWKGVGVISMLTGMILLIGALSGGRDVLQPLSGFRTAVASAPAQITHLPFQRVTSTATLDALLDAARGRYVMLDYYADWCVSCKEMERFTFSDPRVQARLKDAVLLQADVTANSAEDTALLQRFGLFGPPGIIFFDRNGAEIPGARIIGYQDADTFLASLNSILR